MAKTRNFTDEQKAQMVRLSLEGVTQGKIAETFNCSQATVSRIIREHEPVKTKTLTADEQADLIELVGDGVALDEIAAAFDCDVETLEYYVRKHKRAESRAKEREDRVVCGDKFSGMLLDQGNGEFHGTFKNADGTFEHMDLHGYTRETAKDEYERWRQERSGADETYQAVFEKPEKPEGKRVWVVLREDASCVVLQDEGAAYDLAEQVEALSGVKMTVREVAV